MAQVSRRVLDKGLEERIAKMFIKTLKDLKEETEIENFLWDLLSPTERIMLIKRLAIAIMLTKSYTYEAIDQVLKVSSPTIMNVASYLKHSPKGGYQRIVKKILNDEKREELFDKLEEILLSLSPPKVYQSPAYLRKKQAGRKLFARRILRDKI